MKPKKWVTKATYTAGKKKEKSRTEIYGPGEDAEAPSQYVPTYYVHVRNGELDGECEVADLLSLYACLSNVLRDEKIPH